MYVMHSTPALTPFLYPSPTPLYYQFFHGSFFHHKASFLYMVFAVSHSMPKPYISPLLLPLADPSPMTAKRLFASHACPDTISLPFPPHHCIANSSIALFFTTKCLSLYMVFVVSHSMPKPYISPLLLPLADPSPMTAKRLFAFHTCPDTISLPFPPHHCIANSSTALFFTTKRLFFIWYLQFHILCPNPISLPCSCP